MRRTAARPHTHAQPRVRRVVARGHADFKGVRYESCQDKWVIERAMYERRWQGTNLAQTAPGHVIAYEHNLHTNEALRRAGVKVQTFAGDLLAMRNGGPHCLIMPLVRRK